MMEVPTRQRADRPRQLVHPRLKRQTYDRLKAYTARTGVTDSAVVNAALEQYLDRSSDMALILRRLDRVGRAIGRLHRQNDIVAELLATFIQIWFAHTMPIPLDQQKAAKQSATRRYAELIEFVRRRLTNSKHVFVDLFGPEEVDESAAPSAVNDGESDDGDHE